MVNKSIPSHIIVLIINTLEIEVLNTNGVTIAKVQSNANGCYWLKIYCDTTIKIKIHTYFKMAKFKILIFAIRDMRILQNKSVLQ